MISVISVVRKARSRKIADQHAVDRAEQRAARAASSTTAARHRPAPARSADTARRSSHSANIDPTDRSMPPTITTSAMPSTTKPISPACRAVSARRAGGQEAVERAAQPDHDDQQHDHRDRGFGPALGQDLAEQMVRPVAVSQANEGVLHRLRNLVLQWRVPRRRSRGSPLHRARLLLEIADIPAGVADGVLLGDGISVV